MKTVGVQVRAPAKKRCQKFDFYVNLVTLAGRDKAGNKHKNPQKTF